MHWMAVHAPQLALDYRLHRLNLGLPCALCDRHQVQQTNAAAGALGIVPGMRRATALSVAVGLYILDDDPHAQQEALHALATALLPFTPAVSLAAPDTVLLEIAGSLQLFGGPARLTARVRHTLAPLGLTVQLASAPTAKAAWLLAQYQDGLCIDTPQDLAQGLAKLPLTLLPTAAPHAAALAAMGIRHFGALAQLPRAGVARRYGQALLADIDAALGHRAEPRAWFAAPAQFKQHLELHSHTDQAQTLMGAAQHLLQALQAWLRARQAGTRQLILYGEHEAGRHARPASTLHLRLSQASRDLSRWSEVLREHLNTWTLPAPVRALSLECTQTESLAQDSGLLFAHSPCATESRARLLDRLQARLGREQVQGLVWTADHRPERAYQIRPIDSTEPTAAPPQPEPARPLWLLDTPVALAERQHRPWWRGPLPLLSGPERIETGWWDGPWVQRDYFIAETAQGIWLWIYRDRQPAAGGWFLQGLFG